MPSADPSSNAPLIGIIVVAYNSRRFLARQRAALEAQTEKRWRWVLLDNASAPDQRPSQAELPEGALLIQSETNLGFAGGNNAAVQHLDTPFIALLNPDAFPEPNWLEELLAAAARHPDASAFGSTQIADETPELLDGAGDELFAFGIPYRALHGRPLARNRAEGETFAPCAAAALYRTDAFRALGGFDERYFCFGEDVDLGYRLRLRGGKAIQATRAVVRHVGGGASGSDFSEFHGARNRLWVYFKNTPSPFFEVLMLWHIVATLAVLLARPKAQREAAINGFTEGLRGLEAIGRARRETQATRTVSPWRIARAWIWSPFGFMARAPKRR